MVRNESRDTVMLCTRAGGVETVRKHPEPYPASSRV